MRRCVILALLCFVFSFAFAGALTGITVKEKPNSSQVTLSFTDKVSYKYFVLRYPWRIVFDFDNAKLRLNAPITGLHARLVRKVRAAEHANTKLRVVIDANKFSNIALKKQKMRGAFEMTIAVMSPKAKPKLNRRKQSSPRKQAVLKVLKPKLRNVVVAIDPGHGGKDPGAIGASGVREKRVVLAIAKLLKRMVDRTPGMEAKLTRRGDYYIPLRRRLALARQYDADIFISIHADAYRNRRSHGASVYALSQRGATSEAARWLAAKENYSELGGVDLAGLEDKSGLVRSVLIDLSQTATIGASLTLGKQVLKYLNGLAVLHHKSVEQAPFVVLKSPDIPSILVETGFISNRTEERRLRSPYYQKRLARSIYNGLKTYFSSHPPKDSYLAHRSQYHRVGRGESLSKIAKRYGVSVQSLKRLNRLSSNVIKRNQRLKIPNRV